MDKKDVNLSGSVQRNRNYELDFLKLVFALIVFLYHTRIFIGENTKIEVPSYLGEIAVHFFFVVTGMLTANSAAAKDSVQNPAKEAVNIVIRKFKGIAAPYFAAMFMGFVVRTDSLEDIPVRLAKIFPEMFAVYSSGNWMNNNPATWYISAMLICMLPLVYLLLKKRDFTIYVFSPIAAVITLGYMCQTEGFSLADHTALYGAVMGSFIRGICGLCFGICAFSIYSKIKYAETNRNYRILLTVIELLSYLIFFAALFVFKDKRANMSVLLILPIALAITFSGKSYVGSLFKSKWMKFFGPLSLYIYLNHFVARDLTERLIEGASYKKSVFIQMILTVVLCLLNFAIVKLSRLLWNRKIKCLFSQAE